MLHNFLPPIQKLQTSVPNGFMLILQELLYLGLLHTYEPFDLYLISPLKL